MHTLDIASINYKHLTTHTVRRQTQIHTNRGGEEGVHKESKERGEEGGVYRESKERRERGERDTYSLINTARTEPRRRREDTRERERPPEDRRHRDIARAPMKDTYRQREREREKERQRNIHTYSG